ncbi:MAG TPA: RidA family protein [Chitinophagaceae bacterium]|jgi:2-iminobutanoate/2-iminopropanoate deaminase|nr:RidA family protein [Chitinophagaceae bacterium]
MEIKPIYPDAGKKPKGHYAPAIIHNGIVYVSGQLPIHPDGTVQTGTIEEETTLCMKNIERILLASGSSLNHILKVNVFIADIGNWPKFNETFAAIMGEHRPARIVVPCNQLNYGCGIEIDCIAAVGR